jgi:hypothetical protein
MSKDKVKFYGLYDYATSINLDLAKTFLSSFDFKKTTHSLNDILECYNILKYIEAGFSDTLPIGTKENINKLLGIYFHSIDPSSFACIYKSMDTEYHSDFWELYAKYKLYNSIDSTIFLSFIESVQPEILFILQMEKIVYAYDSCIKQ